MLEDFGDIEPIGVVEGASEEWYWNGETDAVEIPFRGHAVLGDLIDVEAELGADVLARAFGVVDVLAVLLGEFGELLANGEINCVGMTDSVAEVMGEGADGECEVVGSFGFVEERADEVAAADVVEEVREVGFAERIVAEVLNEASAVGIGVRFAEFSGGEGREALKQEGLDGVGPGEVDDLLVGEDRVGFGGLRDR